MATVTDAVILAGGRGTRMLPATLYTPKEAMSLLDTPILHHLIWEAAGAGATRVHLVLSPRKAKLLSDAFSDERRFNDQVRPDLPRSALTPQVDGMEIVIHLQSRPGGVGDAISTVLHDLNGPFLVLLGDVLLIKDHMGPHELGPSNASEASMKLVQRFEQTGLPCVGISPVSKEDVCKYGVAKLKGDRVESIIEKPDPTQSPSHLVLCGRYILPENTSEILELYPENEYGELQSIALLNHLIKYGGLEAVKLDRYQMYDSGDPLSWLKSQVDHALRREDFGDDIRAWLSGCIGV